MVPTGPRQFCIFCHLCNAIAVCKSVHQNSPAIPVSFSHKTSNICKRKYFALHGPVLFKTFTECHFGKHVFSPDNRDFSAMLGLFKSRIKILVALIYHVWATKWNIYFGSGNHILEILKGNSRSFSVLRDRPVTIKEATRIRVAFPVRTF